MDERWRIAVIAAVPPVAAPLVEAVRANGHEPVAIIGARTKRPIEEGPPVIHPGRYFEWIAPEIPLYFPATKWEIEGLLRLAEPDLALCFGYPWKIPLEALQVPRLGSVNQHPARLPRHRGPFPMAWAMRAGDGAFGLTWHRMDAELDTGPILAQGTVPVDDDDTTIEQMAPKLHEAAFALLPEVFRRVAAGDPGDPQPEDPDPVWAAPFGEDYATVDWSQPARAIHDQVRAWHLTFGAGEVPGPIAELDGQRVRLFRTSLTEKPEAVARVEAGDGPIWILEHEPAPPSSAEVGDS